MMNVVTRQQMKILIQTVIYLMMRVNVTLQEVDESSDDDESDSKNDEILLPLNSRTGSNVQHI